MSVFQVRRLFSPGRVSVFPWRVRTGLYSLPGLETLHCRVYCTCTADDICTSTVFWSLHLHCQLIFTSTVFWSCQIKTICFHSQLDLELSVPWQFCGEYRRTSFRFLDLISHLEKPTWRLLVTTDLLSQVLGLLWHPRSDIWRLWVWRLNWELLIYSGFHLISRSHFILCGLNYYVLTFKLIIWYNALIVYIHVFILYLYF